jgi:uncharacterized protein (DUF736 family)
MAHYTLTVPVKYDDNGTEKTTYRRVGAVFENTKRDTGETFLTLKLDFPLVSPSWSPSSPPPKAM